MVCFTDIAFYPLFVCSHYFDGFSNKNGIVDCIFLGVTGVIFQITIYFSLKRLFLFVCLI